MEQPTLKERAFFGLICNEKRVYHHWYSRFLSAQVDTIRIYSVVKRTGNWFHWLCFPLFATKFIPMLQNQQDCLIIYNIGSIVDCCGVTDCRTFTV